MGAISIEQVLAEEAAAIHGDAQTSIDALRHTASSQQTQTLRVKMDADSRSDAAEDQSDVARRKAFYRALNKLNRAALCCSGGGIRSATFCLGVIQALAQYDVTSPPPGPAPEKIPPSDTEPKAPVPRHHTRAENSLLGRFHYLSTVSGGGYIGSWLSAWRKRDDFPTVIANLTSRPDGADIEPAELSWLRAYSNYLTPKVGVASADAWAGVAIYFRNLLLNWLIIVPAICLVLLALKAVVTWSVALARATGYDWLIVAHGIFGVLCLIVAQAFVTSHRPTRRQQLASAANSKNVTQSIVLRCYLLWSVVSAIAVTVFFTSRFGAMWVASIGKYEVLGICAIAGFVIYSLGWLAGWPMRPSRKDYCFWAWTGPIYGVAVGFGAYLFTLLHPYAPLAKPEDAPLWTLLLPMIFGVPWVLLSQMLAEMIFVGLTSYEKGSDSDREWLGRAAGWVAASAVVWAIAGLLVLAGGHFLIEKLDGFRSLIGSAGGIAGIATALLGRSTQARTKAKSEKPGTKDMLVNIGLAVAGPVFGAALIVLLSVALDELLLGGSLVEALRIHSLSTPYILAWFAIGGVVLVVVEWLASFNVNINRFSLNALYRNRLIRAYLGASRQTRDPDKFTGFDVSDNIRVHKLWPQRRTPDNLNSYSLFHVVNIALNVVSTKRLAWQQRKAESFTVSPLHSGSAYKGFRPSEQYGDYPNRGGITLGTAMAVSGAAASPNMGSNTTPSLSILLALFNVRLGWWLGNPGKEGDVSYQSDGPSFALWPLVQETFGLTTDERKYVYLSDGGHFENLGLYEMVRRRCRFIVAIDAGCDPDFAFEDLGNAVRKIYIDQGIRIRFDDLQTIRNRPTDKALLRQGDPPTEELRRRIPYYAIGVIDYKDADGDEPGCENGYVLYIKPAYHGSEGAGIRSYATAHPEFPHEPTADQWFTESQFESYRSLGLDIANEILSRECVLQARPDRITLHEVLAGLAPTIRA